MLSELEQARLHVRRLKLFIRKHGYYTAQEIEDILFIKFEKNYRRIPQTVEEARLIYKTLQQLFKIMQKRKIKC